MSVMKVLDGRLRKRPAVNQETRKDIAKKLRLILKQDSDDYTKDDKAFLKKNHELVEEIEKRRRYQDVLKRRVLETEEDASIVTKQCKELAEALSRSVHAVVYTGAGISTSANIPDYRGTCGVWTNLKRGDKVELEQSLVNATPTVTHMALRELVDVGIVSHVVSQNCDGLHLRSGIPSAKLSEVHGNMYVEVCADCDVTYYRDFDVTENTALRRHKTKRFCLKCGKSLRDSIVHFGERSKLKWPHNWEGAVANAEKADVILCLGTSLKVLKSYKQLWLTDRPKCKRPLLYIVNLQWTPKDSAAKLKIHGKVDFVMENVMKNLKFSIPAYSKKDDLLFSLVGENKDFRTTESSKKCSEDLSKASCSKDDKLQSEKKEITHDKLCLKFECNTEPEDVFDGSEEDETVDVMCRNGRNKISKVDNEVSDPESKVTVPAWFGKGLRTQKRTGTKKSKRKRSVKA